MIFHTLSGSVYQINGKQIRLVSSPRSPRGGMTKEWQFYEHADVEPGFRAVISWPSGDAVVTTVVTKVEA